MSHVSENAFRGDDRIADLILEFTDRFSIERIKPSEMAAVFMIGSPTFGKLLDIALENFRENELPDDAIELMSNA